MAVSLTSVARLTLGIHSEETPKYEVLSKERNIEVRIYKPFIAAKTSVEGDRKHRQGKAFRILAGYIFGANSTGQQIAMTAPVIQSPQTGGWAMRFMMPSKYRMSELPSPRDQRVTFETVPAKKLGVIRFSGLANETKTKKKSDELRTWLTKAGYEITGGPSIAGYDPPWTVPFLRRNEVMYEIRPIDLSGNGLLK